MVARTIAQGFAVMVFEAAEHGQVVTHGGERRQNLRQIVRRADSGGTPVAHINAIGYIHKHHAIGRNAFGGLSGRAEGGQHGVERR